MGVERDFLVASCWPGEFYDVLRRYIRHEQAEVGAGGWDQVVAGRGWRDRRLSMGPEGGLGVAHEVALVNLRLGAYAPRNILLFAKTFDQGLEAIVGIQL